MLTRRAIALPCLAAGLAFALWGSARTGGGAAQGTTAQEMLLTVTVTDSKKALVPNLPREAFSVSDGRSPQETTSFVGGDAPARVGILLDASGSVKKYGARSLRPVADALARLVELGHVENEYTVVGFAEQVLTVVEGSRDRAAVTGAVAAVFAATDGGNSALYDACYTLIPKLAAGGGGKRALVIVSDGEDTYSRAREDDILRLLKEKNVVVYSLFIERDRSHGPRVSDAGQRVLERLAKESGGLSFTTRQAKELDAHAERIAAELRHQYVIGFRPAAPLAPGKCRDFKIAVAPSADAAPAGRHLTARGREEFCAPAPVRR
jgi:Ca-activated chloride channel family protein